MVILLLLNNFPLLDRFGKISIGREVCSAAVISIYITKLLLASCLLNQNSVKLHCASKVTVQ